jgi:hypothetical protein
LPISACIRPLQILDRCPIWVLAITVQRHRGHNHSGGIQEETTYLGIPCLTLRENTERPVTVSLGTNVLVGRDPDKLRAELSASSLARRRREPSLLFGMVTRTAHCRRTRQLSARDAACCACLVPQKKNSTAMCKIAYPPYLLITTRIAAERCPANACDHGNSRGTFRSGGFNI